MKKRRFRGQSIVEFALISPLFLAMIFGVIDGGRLLFTYHQVNHASKEGARYAAAHGSKAGSADQGEIQSHISSVTTGLNSGALTVNVSWPDGGNDPRELVLVDVTYAFQPVVAMVFGTSPIELNSSSKMMIHY